MSVSSREKLLAAAVDRFASNGLAVTMEEVAKHAGVTRRTLYRAFPDRRTLVEAVAILRLDAIIGKVQRLLESQEHLADALVTGFVAFIGHARADKVFMAALDEASEWRLERFLVGPEEEFFKRAELMWKTSMTRAIALHEWRPGLDPAKVNMWLRGVAVILLMRDDLDARGQEDVVRTFVVPALVADPAARRTSLPAAKRRSSSKEGDASVQ